MTSQNNTRQLQVKLSQKHVIISMLLVQNSFIKNLFILKSRDANCVLFRGQATRL